MRKILRDFGLVFYEGEYVSIFRVAFVFALICFYFKPSTEALGVVTVCASACLGNKKIPNKFSGDDQ